MPKKTETADVTAASAETTKPAKVTVILPSDPLIRDSNGNTAEQQEFFSVNGKNVIIKCDEPVEVDAAFAEVINNRAKARREAQKFIKEKAFKDSKPPEA